LISSLVVLFLCSSRNPLQELILSIRYLTAFQAFSAPAARLRCVPVSRRFSPRSGAAALSPQSRSPCLFAGIANSYRTFLFTKGAMNIFSPVTPVLSIEK
jgi:hypothetical protein